MKVHFCDACGKTLKPAADVNKVEFPCHLFSKSNELGYTDNEGNRVSGRKDVVELCNACNNAVMSKAVSAFQNIQKESSPRKRNS